MRWIYLASTLAACGVDTASSIDNQTTFDIKLKNEYAESIFTVVAAMDGVSPQTAMDEVRVPSYEIAVSKYIKVPLSAKPLKIDIKSMSLGEEYSFGPFDVEVKRGTLCLVYRYDLALAKFSIGAGWSESGMCR